jgi:transcriptional regulator with XRE-family HTH domain
MTVNGTDLRRRELAAFLRSRRERIGPEQVGLPPTRRRRTPGLRREEVAQLAGVGVTWYTWLEQGRDINPSAQVLDAVARTLRLDTHERSHLFTLAGLPDTAIATIALECDALCPTAQLLLDQLEPFPACVVNARWDLLAFNRAYASIFDGLETMPIEDRNCLWLAFTDPSWRAAIVDWEEGVARLVAQYRAAMAEYIDARPGRRSSPGSIAPRPSSRRSGSAVTSKGLMGLRSECCILRWASWCWTTRPSGWSSVSAPASSPARPRTTRPARSSTGSPSC